MRSTKIGARQAMINNFNTGSDEIYLIPRTLDELDSDRDTLERRRDLLMSGTRNTWNEAAREVSPSVLVPTDTGALPGALSQPPATEMQLDSH